MVRGQFRGYRDEPGVAKDSHVATYAALRLYVDSWRWEGVPFYVRAGKCLEDDGHRGAGRAEACRRRSCSRKPTPSIGQLRALPPEPAGRDRHRRARQAAGRRHGRRAGRALGRASSRPRRRPGRLRAAARRRDGGRRHALRARRTWSKRPGRSSIRCIHGPSPLFEYEPGHVGTAAGRPPRRRRRRLEHTAMKRILVIDVGGTNVKVSTAGRTSAGEDPVRHGDDGRSAWPPPYARSSRAGNTTPCRSATPVSSDTAVRRMNRRT